jgi:hypothetical protein
MKIVGIILVVHAGWPLETGTRRDGSELAKLLEEATRHWSSLLRVEVGKVQARGPYTHHIRWYDLRRIPSRTPRAVPRPRWMFQRKQ